MSRICSTKKNGGVDPKKSKSSLDTVELKMTSLAWNPKKMVVCSEDDFLLMNFTFQNAVIVLQKVRFSSENRWTLQWLVSACFPFQPLQGDVVGMGTSCFFFKLLDIS